MKSLTAILYTLLLILSSCAPETPKKPPVYYGCTGSQICAYDAFGAFLGIVENKNDTGLEFITNNDYRIFLNTKGFIVNEQYQRYQPLTNLWPIDNRSQLGIFTTENTQQSPQLVAMSMIVDTEPEPVFLCYTLGRPNKITELLGLSELRRIGEIEPYKGLYQYQEPDKITTSGYYYPATLCSIEDVGLPSIYFTRPIIIKTAQGEVYTGNVSSGVPI